MPCDGVLTARLLIVFDPVDGLPICEANLGARVSESSIHRRQGLVWPGRREGDRNTAGAKASKEPDDEVEAGLQNAPNRFLRFGKSCNRARQSFHPPRQLCITYRYRPSAPVTYEIICDAGWVVLRPLIETIENSCYHYDPEIARTNCVNSSFVPCNQGECCAVERGAWIKPSTACSLKLTQPPALGLTGGQTHHVETGVCGAGVAA